MRNLSLSQIASDLGASIAEENAQIAGYQVDSRLVSPGDLFFALGGEKTDGHLFLSDARQKGATAAVVKKGYQGPDFGLHLLPVEDVLTSLQELARKDLLESRARVIGVTGSVGKTTTKDFIAELLASKYKVGKTPGNYNTKLTLPLSILNREGGEEVFVLEMGMSEPGDIGKLLKIAQPEIAVVTKVALAHAAFFPGGLKEIAAGKAEIFSSPKLKKAVFFQNLLDHECFANLQKEKVIFSLEDRSADYFLFPIDIPKQPQESALGLRQSCRQIDDCNVGSIAVDEKGVRSYQFDLPFKNQAHLLHNFLAAISTVRQIGLEWDAINAKVPFLKAPQMRFEMIERNGVRLINDAYNANPESMRAAFLSLPLPREGGKSIGVLGTMSPLGSFSESAHRDIGRFAREYFDLLLVLGEEAYPLFESYQEMKKPAEFFTDIQTLATRLQTLMSSGDVVLVKGSRCMKMESLFDIII